ncbi:hypothetical protein EV421DRAFT_1469274 [Armillaria borealis]|uniref:Uncharacterized protein n=1 Tax=Armillaria borealis TaxID=47425 RepID=A0AA39JXT9_9AGAR|nr:hypothetical protein EV421DRAFT_1469274 [Armillaria borealis]
MTLCGLLIHCLHESVALSMPPYINLRMTSTPYFMSFFLVWHKELSNLGCCSFQFVDPLPCSWSRTFLCEQNLNGRNL